ncbi:hypothetical protein Ciccas_013602, partial [Cichlidogyrus casuarinus]
HFVAISEAIRVLDCNAATSGHILPSLQIIRDHLVKESSRSNLAAKLLERFRKRSKICFQNPHLIAATLIHPEFKKDALENDHDIDPTQGENLLAQKLDVQEASITHQNQKRNYKGNFAMKEFFLSVEKHPRDLICWQLLWRVNAKNRQLRLSGMKALQ